MLRAFARQTSTIPIVFAIVSDPIGGGFAKSLTQPGANITGMSNRRFVVKGLELPLPYELGVVPFVRRCPDRFWVPARI